MLIIDPIRNLIVFGIKLSTLIVFAKYKNAQDVDLFHMVVFCTLSTRFHIVDTCQKRTFRPTTFNNVDCLGCETKSF